MARVKVSPEASIQLRHRIRTDQAVFAKSFFGWTPHEKQVEIFKAIRNPVNKVITISAGRRGGKTECMAMDGLHYGITNAGSLQFIISATNDQATIIFSKMVTFLSSKNTIYNSFVRDIKRGPHPKIILINGSIIEFRSAQNGGVYIRGHGADRVILDEAAYIDDSAIDNAIMPLLADKNGQLVKISTPAGRNHFFRTYCSAMGIEGYPKLVGHEAIRFPSSANPYISAEFLKNVKKEFGTGSVVWRTEYDADFSDDRAAVFQWDWITQAYSKRDFPMLQRAAHNEEYYMGVDIAEQRDYNVICVLRANKTEADDMWDFDIVYFERFHQEGIGETASRIYKALQAFNPVKCVVDQTGQIGNPITLLIPESECTVECINLTNNNKQTLVKYLSSGLERGEIHFMNQDDLEQLVEELKFFQYEYTKTKKYSYGAPEGKNDDCVLGLALGIYIAKSGPTGEIFGKESEKDDFVEKMECKYHQLDFPEVNIDWNKYEETDEDNTTGVVV